MLDLVIDRLGDGHFMAFLLAALGCAATALTVVVPMLQTDNLSRRIRAVSDERERIRQRERERLAAKDNRTQLRSRPSSTLKRLVDTLNLTSWLSTETAKEQLAKAGFRGAAADPDRADDPVLPARPVRGDPHPGGDPDQQLELTPRRAGKTASRRSARPFLVAWRGDSSCLARPGEA